MNATWEFPTEKMRWYQHKSVREVRAISDKVYNYKPDDIVGYKHANGHYRVGKYTQSLREFGFYTEKDNPIIYDRPYGRTNYGNLSEVGWNEITREEAMRLYAAWKLGAL